MMKRVIIGGTSGLFLGILGSIIAVAVSAILAFMQDRRIRIPGVFDVWSDDSGGVRGLAFHPDAGGIATVVATAVILGVVAALYFGRAAQPRHQQA